MKKIRCFSALLLVIFLSGCAQLEEMGAKFDQMAAESRLKEYDSVLDKALVDNFYIISEDGLEYGLSDLAKEDGFSFDSLAQSKIVFEKRMYQSPNMGDMYSTMRGYGYDSESDSLSKAYISMAKKRGNTVKIYRPLMTKKLNQLFTQPFEPMQQTAEWYSKDIALIEFDNNNRPVSIMTRAHQAFTTIGVNSSMYTTIFFGNGNMRHFENNVSNSLLEDAYLRTAS